MTKQELIEELENISKKQNVDGEQYLDEEMAHFLADKFLLKYISDNDITKCFENIKKWYS